MANNSHPNSEQSQIIDQLFGECSAIQSICNQIKLIAPTNCSVLVIGETGTGKGLIAQYIYSLSQRTNKSLITINCTTPPETKLEAELFGCDKKTLTGHHEPSLEQLGSINGATLLIDEISELSLEVQAHLLEILEHIEKKNLHTDTPVLDIRIIATSQHDLMDLVKNNAFNRRLYYFLNVLKIFIPPIRDRGEDKIKIAEKLLVESCKKHSKPLREFSNEAISTISAYFWPGNFRELHNVIERSVILSETDKIFDAILGLDTSPELEQTQEQQPEPQKEPSSAKGINGSEPLRTEPEDDSERNKTLSLEGYFQQFVLENQDSMNETELAQTLGISRKCLWERRQRLGIPRKGVK
jgi:DNA-binding NtrC family response regulator